MPARCPQIADIMSGAAIFNQGFEARLINPVSALDEGGDSTQSAFLGPSNSVLRSGDRLDIG